MPRYNVCIIITYTTTATDTKTAEDRAWNYAQALKEGFDKLQPFIDDAKIIAMAGSQEPPNKNRPTPKYPDARIYFSLNGPSGNAYVILAMAAEAMREAGAPETEIKAYKTEAKKGDYDYLIRTTQHYVNTIIKEETTP